MSDKADYVIPVSQVGIRMTQKLDEYEELIRRYYTLRAAEHTRMNFL
jgi:hypothetical protein